MTTSETFMAAVLEHTGCKSLKGAMIKLDILECMTHPKLEPDLNMCLQIIIKTLHAELSNHG